MKKLNNEQYAAATAPMGHNLIIASAGTGKTSTIVARISHLLSLGVNPKKILLLTFTNKAANEMISRLSMKFDEKITSQITAGTFHSVSYSLLKKLNKGVVLKQPSELKILLKSIAARRRFDHISDVKPYDGVYLYDIYSLFQNKELKENFSDWFSKNYEEQAAFSDIYADILEEFEAQKAKFGYADFNDLLIRMRKELIKGAPVAFDEILVDEYQDTNTLQGSLIDSFNTKSLFCVGDFDQSIYAFNGANINIIGSFGTRYKDAKVYNLNINYRSSSQILALANRVISNNERLYPKKLIVGREGNFKNPKLYIYDEIMSQYKSVAQMIHKLLQNGTKGENIAVIFRNNSSADGIEIALRELEIQSKRKGSISFFDSKEVKAATNLLAILVNQKDIMSFINLCEYGATIGAAMSRELFEIFTNIGHNSIVNGFLCPDMNVQILPKKRKNVQLGLFDDEFFGSASRFGDLGFYNEFAKNPVFKFERLTELGAKFLYKIYKFLKSVRNFDDTDEILKNIQNSEIFAHIADFLATKRATQRNGKLDEIRKKDEIIKIYNKLEILNEIALKYPSAERFYNFLTIGSKEIDEGEGVNLLSVHASKGLEFDAVFVVDLAQNRFPNTKLMLTGGNIEEERRLFYVAVTRARNELTLSFAKFDKIRKITYEASVFLKEAGLVK